MRRGWLNNRWLYIGAVLALLALRLVVLPGPAHSYDPGAMMTTAQRFFGIGSSPLMQVAKSPFFLPPFFASYALFLTLTQGVYNPFLELALLKVPTLLADGLVALLLAGIAPRISTVPNAGRLAVLFWLMNPTTYWWGAVAGHYAIFGVATTVLAIYCAVRGWRVAAVVALSFQAALYYYPAILLPFLLVYFAAQEPTGSLGRRLAQMTWLTACFSVAFGIQFLPALFAEGGLFREYLGAGLLWHADSSAQSLTFFDAARPLYYFSWFPFPFQTATGLFPDNVNAPALYALAQRLVPLGPLLAVGYGVWVIYRFVMRGAKGGAAVAKRNPPTGDRRQATGDTPNVPRAPHHALHPMPYSVARWMGDSFIALTLCLLTFSGLHNSFILWLMPFTILHALATRRPALLLIGLLVGIVNQHRDFFFLGIWERVVPLSEAFRLFPWRGDRPDYVLAGFVKMLLLLPGLVYLARQRGGAAGRRVGVAPLGLLILLAVQSQVLLAVQSVALYGAVATGVLRPYTAPRIEQIYLFSPRVGEELALSPTRRQATVTLTRAAEWGDDPILHKYVFSAPYRAHFTFTLVAAEVPETLIRDVRLGDCVLPALGEDYVLDATGPSATYDLTPCLPPSLPQPIAIPLQVTYTADTLPIAPRLFGIAAQLPTLQILPERAGLVTIFAGAGVASIIAMVIVMLLLLTVREPRRRPMALLTVDRAWAEADGDHAPNEGASPDDEGIPDEMPAETVAS